MTSDGGRASTGGRETGGREAAGGDAQTGGAGGGESTGGTLSEGSGGGGGDGGPATFRDDFEANELSADWGANDNYSVGGGVLHCSQCRVPLLSELSLAVPLEASMVLGEFPEDGDELNLVVLTQNDYCDTLEVSYEPRAQVIHLYACWDEIWRDFGQIDATLAPHATLSVKVEVLPYVQVASDDGVLGEFEVTDYPYSTGKVGVSAVGDGEFNFDEVAASEL